MRAPARWLVLAMLAIALGSCENVTTETQTTTLTAALVVEGSPFVTAGDTLVGDTVEFAARVTDETGRPISVGALEFTSSESSIVEILDPSTGLAFLAAPGTTTVSVTIGEPILQGAAEPLAADMEISVVDFGVVVDAVSLVPGSDHLANGKVLVTDSVQFSATVMKGGEEVPVSGAQWSSSDPAVIEIIDQGEGIAAFRDVGTATVSVDFSDPLLPGAPFERMLTVSTFEVELGATSDFPNGPGLSDPLVTDRVTFSATVTLDGEAQPSTIGQVTSTDVDVVEPISSNKALFRGVGDATVTAVLSEPVLPRGTLSADTAMQVATIVAQISGPAQTPIMGDLVDYDVTVTRTRDNSTVSNPTVTFSSTDPNVISITTQATGAAFVRDTGTARVAVVSVNPTLPNGLVSDTTGVTNITVERFYGQFSRTSGSFGQRNADTVIVQRSQEHRFTPSTRIQFPNGIPGFVERIKPDSLIFLVPAGASTGPLTLRNLIDQEGDPRDGVLTRFDFNGPGTGAVNDFFEDNDAFPLSNPSAVNLTNQLPFVALLAIDPNKVAPRDTNFFWLQNPGPGDLVLDITAENQQSLNIDFFVCFGTGGISSDPPTGYDDGACARPKNVNGNSTQIEQELDQHLQQGRHVFGFYCATSCPTGPVSYKVSIVEN